MKQLWAPWRMSYINGDDKDATAGCIFCVRDSADEDGDRLILHRGEHAFIIMNKYPYSNGHLLVAPYRHTADLSELSDAEALEMHRLTVLARDALRSWGNPDGFNIGMNWGRVAGAGIEDHLHLHIVPRWNGDTNFMPVFSDVRVIPQHLQETYTLLAKAMASLT
ncbi:HIT family protein [Geothermobacter hydrogeniphilus]|uniref:HIT family hydrolase n=1 Tax=Geothermobacter hydrogeniphilus TaxID=1969733 RepID=A0A1X0YE86_9BACT|nr:HIT domain-containing protein [Geothermobacter hydrogeniphilus]ORJ63429.1 HIT family hydrolase [Geothermobacter hydrogeniphilus]